MGLRPYCTQAREAVAQYLATVGGRGAAVLDASRPAPYSFATLYQLLHQEPALPTLLLLPPEGPPPLVAGGLAPLDDVARLPAQPAELALRVQALLLRARSTPPAARTASATPPAAASASAAAPATTSLPLASPLAAPTPPVPTADGDAAPLAQPPPTPSHGEALVSGVRLYTDSHLVIGQVDPGRRRLSDHLNDPQRAYLDVAHGYWYDLLAEAGPPLATGAMGVRKDSLQVVVPEETAAPRSAARVPTQRVPITVALPLFIISGQFHRRGSDPAHLLQWFAESGRAFLPIANATIRFLPNGRFDAQVAVALVGIRQVQIWWTPAGPASA
ncbi:MAG TPA: hypothetical protein VK066_20555 [Chloroflexota bacterium]|nr:hypothetical protein [Chloroflexota bacterium]